LDPTSVSLEPSLASIVDLIANLGFVGVAFGALKVVLIVEDSLFCRYSVLLDVLYQLGPSSYFFMEHRVLD